MIFLASKSPRRQELLTQVDFHFECVSIDIDETVGAENVHEYVERMAKNKAEHAYTLYSHHLNQNSIILAADTVVFAQEQILGKPNTFEEFESMMVLLSGGTHQVYSSIYLKGYDGRSVAATSISTVAIDALSQEFINMYWLSGEPKDKAGGYAVQGIMAQNIREICGSYSGIMGLPLYELSQAMKQIGYNSSHYS